MDTTIADALYWKYGKCARVDLTNGAIISWMLAEVPRPNDNEIKAIIKEYKNSLPKAKKATKKRAKKATKKKK